MALDVGMRQTTRRFFHQKRLIMPESSTKESRSIMCKSMIRKHSSKNFNDMHPMCHTIKLLVNKKRPFCIQRLFSPIAFLADSCNAQIIILIPLVVLGFTKMHKISLNTVMSTTVQEE